MSNLNNLTKTLFSKRQSSADARQAWSRALVRALYALVLAGLLFLNRATFTPDVIGGTLALAGLFVVILNVHLRHQTSVSAPLWNAERLILTTALLAVSGVQLGAALLEPGTLTPTALLLIGPLVALAMLISGLLGPSLAIFALTLTTLLFGVTGVLPGETLVGGWLAGVIGSYSVNPLKQRADLLRAVSIQVAVQAVIGFVTFVAIQAAWSDALIAAGWAATAAVLATSIFWLGVALLERAFEIISDWTLLELCSPDHPLLRELVMRAPGTYAHSVMVANLSENAARTIGANPILCRTMAYFHDIGKMTRPSYFIENQVGLNPHDEMSPTLSAQVISSHVRDGVKLAQEHRLPKVIIDGIAEHHGTTMISFFYQKALEQQKPEAQEAATLARFFRYPGPKPQSRETAILHLADMTEASTRTLPRESCLQTAVEDMFERSRADGQLDECELTFKDIQAIKQSFVHTLAALRHERIAYPDADAETRLGLDNDDFDSGRFISSARP